MSDENKSNVLDYSKWDNLAEHEEVYIDVQAPFGAQNIDSNDDVPRVKIPRSPRPLPAEPPILLNEDGLLEPPPYNAPKGAAAVRHYQIGFGHKIINKNKQKGKHRKAFSMSVLDQFEELYLDQNNTNQDTNSNPNHHNPTNAPNTTTETDKQYGIQVEKEDNTALFQECKDLLFEFMGDVQGMKSDHHDYYKHNPHEYYRHKAMATHNMNDNDSNSTSHIHSKDNNMKSSDIPKIDVVLKMGGAFLTNKKQMHTLNEANIEIAAKQIKKAFDSNYVMILVHGAGSYGHFEAKKYKLMNGFFNDESSQGMVLCRAAVSILHQNVIAKLMENRIPVLSVSPCGIVTSSDGIVPRKQWKAFVSHICRVIKNGMVPLIHGDIIFDDKRGCHILSGDSILENLCLSFAPQRAVFWSNIDGVYDCTNLNKKEKKPKLIQNIYVTPQGKPQLNGEVIKQLKNPEKFLNEKQDKFMKEMFDQKDENGNEIENDNNDQIDGGESFEINIDATGGMWGKIGVSSKCCALGVDVVITKGGTDAAQLSLLGKYTPNATVFAPVDL